MYTNNRDAYRQFFFTVWQKYKKKLALSPAEAQLAAVIEQHPEYHALLDKPPHTYEKQEFVLEENPFFHMSLHSALWEQIQSDRPPGIALLYQQLKDQAKDQAKAQTNDQTKNQALTRDLSSIDSHELEHRMMGVLCKMMAQAQETGSMPSDEEYLQLLRKHCSC
jgi:hypothetical protein